MKSSIASNGLLYIQQLSPGESHAHTLAQLKNSFGQKSHRDNKGGTLVCGDGLDMYTTPGGGLCVIISKEACDLARRKLYTAKNLYHELQNHDGVLKRFAPPFACIFRDCDGAPLRIFTDHCGLFQLYICETKHFAAMSTSSSLLARLAGASLDVHAFACFAQFGFFPNRLSPFEQIRKVDRYDKLAITQSGLLEFGLERSKVVNSAKTAGVEDGAATLRQIVEDALSTLNPLGISLSGGLDSRLVLAAIPTQARSTITSFTIDSKDGVENRIASDIARRWGIPHVLSNPAKSILALGDDSLTHLCLAAAAAREYASNPISTSFLQLAESEFAQIPRLNGQNGEFARGFYHANQTQAKQASARRIKSLGRWRVFVGSSVQLSIFHKSFSQFCNEASLSELNNAFELLPPAPDWLRLTDEFYLAGRMQRWAGSEATYASATRFDTSPFFDHRFIDWCRSLPTKSIQNGIMRSLVTHLDRELGFIPLDSSPPPASRGLGYRTFSLRNNIRKSVNKIRQRLGSIDAPGSHTGMIANAVLRHIRKTNQIVEDLPTDSVFSEESIQGILAGKLNPDINTLGFLCSFSSARKSLTNTINPGSDSYLL